MFFEKEKSDLERIAKNLKNQGKSDKEIKHAIFLYLKESKRKINSNREMDFI